MRAKFGNTKLYVIPGTAHRFRTEHDARFYCQEHAIDFAVVEKYDSRKEWDRWNALQLLEREGIISDLRRQVPFELIPAHWEQYVAGERTVRAWRVEYANVVWNLRTKKEATAFCKAHGVALTAISHDERRETVLRERCIEKAAIYTADFVYTRDGKQVVEDVKSEATRKEADYVLRRKLMLHVHGIRVLET